MIGRLRIFNNGFTRFFFSLDDWLLLMGSMYFQQKRELGRRPYQVEDHHKRFFAGLG